LVFGNVPRLANAKIDSEIAGASQVVSLSRFPRIGKAESLDSSSRILEEIRDSINHESACGSRGLSLHRGGGERIVRRPILSRFDSGWKTTGPVEQSGNRPAPEEVVLQCLGVTPETPRAERNVIDPVGIDLVTCVKVRCRTQLVRRPGVDNLAGKATSFETINAFCI
jgi:hypothetical protein